MRVAPRGEILSLAIFWAVLKANPETTTLRLKSCLTRACSDAGKPRLYIVARTTTSQDGTTGNCVLDFICCSLSRTRPADYWRKRGVSHTLHRRSYRLFVLTSFPKSTLFKNIPCELA